MDTYRAFLAILLSFVILIGYQYFFVGFQTEQTTVESQQQESGSPAEQPAPAAPTMSMPQQIAPTPVPQPVSGALSAKKITVDTELYTAVFSEAGGVIESFVLKEHRETSAPDSPGKQLIENTAQQGYPLTFSWGSVVPADLHYQVKDDSVSFRNGKGRLQMSATAPGGIVVEKTFEFSEDNYLINHQVKVLNPTAQPLQGIPEIYQVNVPFEQKSTFNTFLFTGPAAYKNGELSEFKTKEFSDGPHTVQGIFDWVAYEGTYFMCAIIPESREQATFLMQGNEDIVYSRLSGGLDTLNPGEEKVYDYRIFYGPKKLSLLKELGDNLDRSIDFGWFDIIAKPTLALLNFFHAYFKNYGIAIILVTIIFKIIFWPITQKGLKSMKNMQKLQPKMVKIKEKYKDDPQAMNREVMNMYKTYKVNPLGGCLPMLLQIPVFFALYKVLLLCIELRHAPFMLWINDLSAPDRLWIGFEIPWLGGLPVLTLLMGASMFIQQKLTPTTADPMQARIMMMLPVVFTFMFINFASGLVLYWFINNLLSILQQQLINRGAAKKA
ncbi:MAG: membrane protein insertase YidC [Desulfopila sp.]|jgi:YidC/Oxa1 family membrane protein insertase|nr:membrane protein insertase YidC [Desulfopila sp.]